VPDTSPSLEILKRLGLNIPDQPLSFAQPNPTRDREIEAQQANDPMWKQYGRQGLDAIVEGAKGLVGMESDPNASNAGYTANAATNIFGAMDPLMKAGALKAGLPLMMGGLKTIGRDIEEEAPTIMKTMNNLRTNASGESMASGEALSRMKGMKARNEQFVVYDRAGNARPLIGPEAVDYKPRPGETYGVQTPTGFRMLENRGGLVKAYSGK
jgi:hypothetical protein